MDYEQERRQRAVRERIRRRKKAQRRQILVHVLLTVGVLALGIFLGMRIAALRERAGEEAGGQEEDQIVLKLVPQPDFEVQLLTPNPFSRPQESLKQIRGIVIHYTANPGTSAQQNRDYFEGLKDAQTTSVSSHFIVGIEGEIIQCIPSSEIAYASNERNEDTLSIECCHPDETGKFSKETYDSLVHLTSWLCGKFRVAPKAVIRHYDVTGKSCPLYFVQHEDEWKKFLNDVTEYMERNGVE